MQGHHGSVDVDSSPGTGACFHLYFQVVALERRERIEASPSTAAPEPIVMTTGYADLADEERARQVGIRELIQKPPSLAHLASVLNRVSGRD